MANPNRRTFWSCTMLAMAVFVAVAAGCTQRPVASAIAVECEFYYRLSPAESFQEVTATLGPGNTSASEEFGDVAVDARFVDDPGEGPALSVAVSDLVTGREIARQLYQIDHEKGLVDQFVGGHGFTGLHYVFHPTSSAELQYFCAAGS